MSQQKNNKKQKHGKKKQPWPMILLFGTGLLLVIGAVFAFAKPSLSKSATDGTGSASLTVDKEKVDLGDVKLGQTVQVTFQITNTGDKTLRFTKAPYVEVLQGC
jgi:hypothetical protein